MNRGRSGFDSVSGWINSKQSLIQRLKTCQPFINGKDRTLPVAQELELAA